MTNFQIDKIRILRDLALIYWKSDTGTLKGGV